MPHPEWSWLLIAFLGGAFGAAVGAFPSFLVCAVSLIVGSTIAMISGDTQFLQVVTWGPFLGPQAALAGGVAAAAYAASTGRLDSGRDVVSPLIRLKSPAVLAMGGVFGLLGFSMSWLLSLVPSVGSAPWINPIAIAIVLTGLISRMMFGRTGLLGRVREGERRFSPPSREDTLPWHLRPLKLMLLSVSISVPVAAIASSLQTHGLFLGLAAMALAAMLFGRRIPVFLHIAAASEMVAGATGNFGWGIVAGLLAGILGELFACLFLIHGDTHVDPPAMVLAAVFALSPLPIQFVGASPGMVAPLMAAIGVVAIGSAMLVVIQREKGTDLFLLQK